MPLTPGQTELKSLADQMLSENPRGGKAAYQGFRIGADPQQVEQRLRSSSFGGLLLKEGASLAGSDGEINFDLDLVAGDAELVAVELCARGGEFPKVRASAQTALNPSKIVEFPGQQDWTRQIDIRLWYRSGDQVACQELSLFTSSLDEGYEPTLTRDVVSLTYEELGYEGLNAAMFEGATNRQIREFLQVARQLFEQRVVSEAQQRHAGGLE
jgi:hypothetical protein